MLVSASTRTPVDLLTIRSPAKLNLSLRIFRLRADGYHDLRSLVVGLELYDDISVRVSESGSGDDRLTCDLDASLGSAVLDGGADNLIRRAIDVCRCEGFDVPRLDVSLTKRIPIGGGLGGGSGNAAGVLAGLNEWFDWGLSGESLRVLAGRIGSDVPLFFSLPAVVMTGRGEVVDAVSPAWAGWALLVFGGIEVSTRQTYAAWDEMQVDEVSGDDVLGGRERTDDDGDDDGEIEGLLEAGSAGVLSGMLVNDLEPAVCAVAERVGELQERVSRVGGPAARLSGAGSTIYQLFDKRDDAADQVLRLRASGIEEPMVVSRTHVCPVINY